MKSHTLDGGVMSPGQILSDVNLQESKTKIFLPYCPVDVVGGMSFTLVLAVHYQIIDFADVDWFVVLAAGCQRAGQSTS